jgi:hypothetical protein
VNWSRGLFRFWILFSLVWVAGCIGIAIVDQPATATYNMEDKNSEKFVVIAPRALSAEQIVDYFIASKKMNRSECAPERRGPWCDQQTTLEVPGPVRWGLWATAAGGPLALLIIGSALFWALRGFRQAA